MRDMLRRDGRAYADSVSRVVEMLRTARISCSDDALPKDLKPSHAKLALALADGLSIQEASSASGLSKRSCERYRHSGALHLVVGELRRLHYAEILEGASDSLSRAVPAAFTTLISAAESGNVSAAREVIRLSSKKHDSKDFIEHSIQTYTTPTLPTSNTNTTPPATLSKAEEHPSPEPEYLRTIEPMWTTQPIKENDDAPLHTE